MSNGLVAGDSNGCRVDRRLKTQLVVQGCFGAVSLTPREVETLKWVMRGKTIVKVAEVMAISPRTVEYYFLTIKRKMGCRTKSSLMNWVVENDILADVV
jgi:DNA-binding CsgD family transcriptional regulator